MPTNNVSNDVCLRPPRILQEQTKMSVTYVVRRYDAVRSTHSTQYTVYVYVYVYVYWQRLHYIVKAEKRYIRRAKGNERSDDDGDNSLKPKPRRKMKYDIFIFPRGCDDYARIRVREYSISLVRRAVRTRSTTEMSVYRCLRFSNLSTTRCRRRSLYSTNKKRRNFSFRAALLPYDIFANL